MKTKVNPFIPICLAVAVIFFIGAFYWYNAAANLTLMELQDNSYYYDNAETCLAVSTISTIIGFTLVLFKPHTK